MLGGGYHADKFRPFLSFAAADTVVAEDVLVRHNVAVLFGVLADLLDLAVRGELRLIVGADADIRRGGF